ncbi:MAG: hypothetical protein QM677_10705 [Microbacterium sp.]
MSVEGEPGQTVAISVDGTVRGTAEISTDGYAEISFRISLLDYLFSTITADYVTDDG